MKLTETEKTFAEWLKEAHTGQQSAVTAKEMSHWGKGVQIREMVHRLRVNGYPICSGEEGYYYAETRKDVERTLNSLRSRYNSILNAYNGLHNGMEQLFSETV